MEFVENKAKHVYNYLLSASIIHNNNNKKQNYTHTHFALVNFKAEIESNEKTQISEIERS